MSGGDAPGLPRREAARLPCDPGAPSQPPAASEAAAAAQKALLRRHYRRWRRLAIAPCGGGSPQDDGSAGKGSSAAASQPSILTAALRELPPLLAGERFLGLYWPLAGEPDLRPASSGLASAVSSWSAQPGSARPTCPSSP